MVSANSPGSHPAIEPGSGHPPLASIMFGVSAIPSSESQDPEKGCSS